MGFSNLGRRAALVGCLDQTAAVYTLWNDIHIIWKRLSTRQITFTDDFLQYCHGCWAVITEFTPLLRANWCLICNCINLAALFQPAENQAMPTHLEFKTQTYLWSFLLCILEGFAQHCWPTEFLAESDSALILPVNKMSICLFLQYFEPLSKITA